VSNHPARRGGRTNPRRGEAKAHFIYLIKRTDGAIKVGISKNVRRHRSQLANASPDKLSILKIVRSSPGLAFQIETAVKFLLRPFRVRGEWFNCSDALALLALRAAKTGELECRACCAAEIERHRLENAATPRERELDRELTAFEALHGGTDDDVEATHLIEMWRRWPDLMREVDPVTVKRLEQPRQRLAS
jgi:Meiotically up-regulated gene 113